MAGAGRFLFEELRVFADERTGEASAPGSPHTSLKAVIRAHILRALKHCRGKMYGTDGAAALLGLKPSALQAKLKRLGIDRRRIEEETT